MNKDNHTQIYTAPQMVKCPECDGTGEGKDKSVYVGGEFYGDCIMACNVCDGDGKIPLEEFDDYNDYSE